MFNEELARRALKEIKARPEEWEQDTWRCRTGMCFAGFVAFAAGATWASTDTDDITVRTPDGRRKFVSSFAAEQLGIDNEGIASRDLFSAYNTFEELERLVNEYSGRNNKN
jgi:hypothetical protein